MTQFTSNWLTLAVILINFLPNYAILKYYLLSNNKKALNS